MESRLSIRSAAGERIYSGSHRGDRVLRWHPEREQKAQSRTQRTSATHTVRAEAYPYDWHTAAENLVAAAIRAAYEPSQCVAKP